MKANYAAPDGVTFDANEIHEDSPEKPGPWFCKTEGCSVQFSGHRVASYAVDEPGRIVRSGSFPHGADRAHIPGCYLNSRAIKQRLLADHRAVLTEEGDKLLLKWGDGPRLDTPSRDDPAPRERREGQVRDRYAAIMRAATDIAKVVDDSDNDDAVLARYWVIHNGHKIAWRDFCYGPEGDDLHRIIGTIPRDFNPTIAPTPRLVRAMVADPANVTDKRVMLNLRAPTKRSTGEYVRLTLFAKPGTAEAVQLRSHARFEMVYILADNWKLYEGRPQVWVTKSEQLTTAPSPG